MFQQPIYIYLLINSKPAAIEHNLEVPMDQMMVGGRRKLKITRKRECVACGGKGGRQGGATERCSACQGEGVKVYQVNLEIVFHSI